MSTVTSLQLVLRPSRTLFVVLAGLHCATLLPLWSAGLPGLTGVAITLAIFAHGVWVVRRHALLRSPRAVTGLTLTAGGNCTLTLREGTRVTGAVDPATMVIGTLVILAVRRNTFRPATYVTIVADMLANDDFRRLRVGLKWGGAQRSDAGHA